MSKQLSVPPDAERVVIDLLTALLAGRGEDVTVGVDVPTAWASGTKPHVQVGLDGTPEIIYPILARASVRVTVWHSSTTTAKRLANLSMGLLLSYAGNPQVASFQALTGVLPTKDPDTKAQLAGIAVRANLRFAAL